MKRVATLLASLLLAVGIAWATPELAPPRTWSVWFEAKTCGCEIAWVEVHSPTATEPLLAQTSRFIVQWTFRPEYDVVDGKHKYHMASVPTVLRQMEKQGYWRYVFWIKPGNSVVAQPTEVWLTPFGVAMENPGPMPKSNDQAVWQGWFQRHRWTHEDWSKEFHKLWRKGGGKIDMGITFKTRFCIQEEGEFIACNFLSLPSQRRY